MRINDYSVVIVPGKEVAGGYVEMQNGQKYQIRLRNSNSTRCDARVVVDGEHVGTFRLGAYQSATIEHPVDDQGCFTFYKLGTREARQAQLRDNDDLGLVSVTFTPEKNMIDWPPIKGVKGVRGHPVSYETQSLAAGGTGLSGHSDQRYGRAQHMNLDHSRATTINLRLVSRERGYDEPRPLASRGNPVPPRV
jgi:hypothetical protein